MDKTIFDVVQTLFHVHRFALFSFCEKVCLTVSQWLFVRDILRCGQMSKRIRSISMDESLWENINLLFKKVPIRFLELVLKNGCKYLSLFGAKLIGETEDFNQFWKNCRALKRNKLVYLELMDCQVTGNGDYGVCLESILDSCHSLQNILRLAP